MDEVPGSVKRVVDATRQGAGTHEPDEVDLGFCHPPVPLEEALAEVAAWGDWGPFRLHQIARALRDGLEAERRDAKRIVDEMRERCAEAGVSVGKLPPGSRHMLPHDSMSLEEVLGTMDRWGPGMTWVVHEMCRVLRRAHEEQLARAEAAIAVNCTGGRLVPHEETQG